MALGLQEENHGGHTALGCMQILVNAMNSNLGDDDAAKEDNAESIAALADLLYHQAGTFCDCAAKASDSCPLCSSFVHVKTLLYESLDACQSLDEIDCDAWMEFHAPCKDKILSKFGSVDFNSDEQCKFGWGHWVLHGFEGSLSLIIFSPPFQVLTYTTDAEEQDHFQRSGDLIVELRFQNLRGIFTRNILAHA